MEDGLYFKNSRFEYKIEDNTFKENDLDLSDELNMDKNIDDEKKKKILESSFKSKIKSKISELTREFSDGYDNVILFLGAGASVNGKATGGVVMKNLVEIVKSNLSDGIFEGHEVYKLSEIMNFVCYDSFSSRLSRNCDKKKIGLKDLKKIQLNKISKKMISNNSKEVKIKYINTNREVINKVSNLSVIDLENLISKIFAFEKFANKFLDGNGKKKYLNTKKAIMSIIMSKTSYDYNDDDFNHKAVINYLSRNVTKSDKKLNIVTTNYDTLIEDAAEELEFTVFDGFSFSRKPKFNADLFDWNLVKPVEGVDISEKIYKQNVINLLKLHGSLTWLRDGSEIIRCGKEEFQNSPFENKEIPAMIFPSSNKFEQTYEEPYFSLFSKFQELLKRKNTLLIISGFSFSDSHIREMIITSIKNNPDITVLITDYRIDDGFNGMDSLMEHKYNVTFLRATVNGELKTYLGEIDNDY